MLTNLPHLLANGLEPHHTPAAAPPVSVLAQYESALPFVIGGLILLLIVVLMLLWFQGRKSHSAPPVQSEISGAASSPIVVPPPSQPAVITLEFTAESGQPISFTLDKPAMTVGRAPDNDIVLAMPILNADTVSQHHARLRRDQDDYTVRDLGSKNGLAVNGRQTIENVLRDGDRLQFGEVEAVFHQSAGGAA